MRVSLLRANRRTVFGGVAFILSSGCQQNHLQIKFGKELFSRQMFGHWPLLLIVFPKLHAAIVSPARRLGMVDLDQPVGGLPDRKGYFREIGSAKTPWNGPSHARNAVNKTRASGIYLLIARFGGTSVPYDTIMWRDMLEPILVGSSSLRHRHPDPIAHLGYRIAADRRGEHHEK